MSTHGRNALELPPEEAPKEIRRQRTGHEGSDIGLAERQDALLWWMRAMKDAIRSTDRREQRRLLRWSPMIERFGEQVRTYLEVGDA